MALKVGDVALYNKTGTVGRVAKLLELDSKVWVELDSTGLLYDENLLERTDASKLKKKKEEAESEKAAAEPKESLEKDMKDEGVLDSSANICGAG